VSALIPADAIDPAAAREQWVAEYLWHVDQLPYVVETTGTIAVAVRGVQAAKLTERVSGGGYVDNVPLVDGPEARNARAVWDALRGYLVVAASRLGVEAPQLPPGLPDDVELAREWAYTANAWLSDAVEHIQSWDDLDALQDQLFRLVRRAMHRLELTATRRARPEYCERCGQHGVLVDWIDGPDGGSVLSKVCIVCRTDHSPTLTKES
jgi:hypothetical protein